MPENTFRGAPVPQGIGEELAAFETDAFDEKNFPPTVRCYRCGDSMRWLPAMKFSGARYECPECGRLIKMDGMGKITILRTGKNATGVKVYATTK